MRREIAITCAKEGAKVPAVARRKERLNDLAEQAKDFAGEIKAYAADLFAKDNVEAMIDEAMQSSGSRIFSSTTRGLWTRDHKIKKMKWQEIFEVVYAASIFVYKNICLM